MKAELKDTKHKQILTNTLLLVLTTTQQSAFQNHHSINKPSSAKRRSVPHTASRE